MQRPEISKVVSLLEGRMMPVVLTGPPGSGKTFIARNSAQALGAIDTDLVAFYISGRYWGARNVESDGEIRDREFYLSQQDEPANGWRKLTLSEPFKVDSTPGGRDKPADLLRLQIEEAYKNSYTIVVVIEDYDLIRTSLPSFELLERYKSEYRVKFLLTSGKNVFQLNGDIPGELEFLRTSSTVKASLPSDEVALEIVNETWFEEKRSVPHSLEDGGASWELGRRDAYLILELAGNYPSLIARLVRLAVRQGTRKWSGPVSRWVNTARREAAFLADIEGLLGLLNRNEKLALQLLAIGHESGCDPGELRGLWERRLNRDGDAGWINLDISLESLVAERLLARLVRRSSGDEFVIASRALADFVAEQDDTRKLGRMLGVPLPRRFRFRPRVFMNLWLLGLAVFVVLTFFPEAGEFRLLVWLPAVCYLVWFAVFRPPENSA